jgi:protein TorT
VVLAGINLTGLDQTISALTDRGIPVIDLQNGLASPKVKAHAVALYFPIMRTLGEYLAKASGASGGTILLLPGPAGASWSEDSARGVIAGIAGSPLKIIDTKYGPTDKSSQIKLVEDGLEAHPDVTYLVGNAVAIEAAAQVVREHGLKNVKLVATYQTNGVIDLLKAGRVSAVAVDSNVIESRIALDQAIRILDGTSFTQFVVMKGVVVDSENVGTWESTSSLALTGFRPVFKVE